MYFVSVQPELLDRHGSIEHSAPDGDWYETYPCEVEDLVLNYFSTSGETTIPSSIDVECELSGTIGTINPADYETYLVDNNDTVIA